MNPKEAFKEMEKADKAIRTVSKLKGTDSFLVVGGHIPCAFYSKATDWFWVFNEKRQYYVLNDGVGDLYIIQDDLKMFEQHYPTYLPLYNDNQVKAFKEYLKDIK